MDKNTDEMRSLRLRDQYMWGSLHYFDYFNVSEIFKQQKKHSIRKKF